MTNFTTRDLNTLMANSVLDTHPPESKIWRDLERNVLLVAETSDGSPYDGPCGRGAGCPADGSRGHGQPDQPRLGAGDCLVTSFPVSI
jgi:hypothetical protein